MKGSLRTSVYPSTSEETAESAPGEQLTTAAQSGQAKDKECPASGIHIGEWPSECTAKGKGKNEIEMENGLP